VRSLSAAILLAVGALGCQSVVPDVRSPHEIPGRILAHPNNPRLGVTGVVFWRDKLYASTNVGLLECTGDRASALYQWDDTETWIEGPWVDRGGDEIWFRDLRSAAFRRWDGREWTAAALPYKKGYLMRLGVRWGFRGTSDAARCCLEGGGYAWSWDRQNREWVVEDVPAGTVYALVPAGDGLYAAILGSNGAELELHVKDRQTWARLPGVHPKDGLRDLLGTAAGGFILHYEGRIIGFDRRGFRNIEQPGPCEAIAATTDGALIASFPGRGIFERRGEAWRLRHPYPYDEKEERHRAYLAESNGVIALVTSALRQSIDPPSWSGTSAIWISKGDVLERVRVE
jgi:hypothetical protein